MRVKQSLFTLFFLLSMCITTAFSKPIQVISGGTISDGLDLSNIRIGEHSTYTRIVFDVTYWEGYGAHEAGRTSDTVGHYKFTLSKKQSIEVEFSGFRTSSVKRINLSATSIVKSIKLLQDETYGDDSSVFYQIQLKHPGKIKVFHLLNPARIVLDVSSGI